MLGLHLCPEHAQSGMGVLGQKVYSAPVLAVGLVSVGQQEVRWMMILVALERF